MYMEGYFFLVRGLAGGEWGFGALFPLYCFLRELLTVTHNSH